MVHMGNANVRTPKWSVISKFPLRRESVSCGFMARTYARGDLIARKFRVEREIGRGGAGVVLAAIDADLDRLVAIKVMTNVEPEDQGPASVSMSRFVREARTVAKLRNRHVVHVYDIQKLDDGTPYIVMEYLEGEALDAVRRRSRKLPSIVAVDYVMQTCVGLAEAHSRGVIHRDLKPENLFVTYSVEAKPLIKILDFGIAKVLDDVKITQDHSPMGTRSYMAPEQFTSFSEVTSSADIWSLGVILYFLLTGIRPFQTEPGEVRDPIKAAQQVSSAPQEPHLIVPTIPPGLSTVVLRCLRRDPSLRYKDVGELAEDLAPYGAEEAQAQVTETKAILFAPPDSLAPASRLPQFSSAANDESSNLFPDVRQFSVNTEEPFPWHDEKTLVDAIANRFQPITFVLGSALTAPCSGINGVPTVSTMIRLIREEYKSELEKKEFDEFITSTAKSRYRTAFVRFNATHGPKGVTRLIRSAVLRSRLGSVPDAARKGDKGACHELERDSAGWSLTPGCQALGQLVVQAPAIFGRLVLTSNFDPLIEIAIKRAGGNPITVALHGDAPLTMASDSGCQVVHFHGDWLRSDTLHSQLSTRRPKLSGSISKLLRETTVVVLGYGGWSDAFTTTLVEASEEDQDEIDVLWAFNETEVPLIEKKYARLLTKLEQAIHRGRVTRYFGVDIHSLLVNLLHRVRHASVEHFSTDSEECVAVAGRQDSLVDLPELTMTSHENSQDAILDVRHSGITLRGLGGKDAKKENAGG